MVTGFWNREFSPKHFLINHNRPNVFVRCQWQKTEDVSITYLIYRCFVACIFLSTLIVSFLDVGRPSGVVIWKWFIYLTNWGFTVCTIQALVAVVILFISWKEQRKQDFPSIGMKMPLLYKIYWVLHTLAVTTAFAITIAYWGTIYKPDQFKLDFINLVTHGGNSILMCLDLFMVSHPTRLMHSFIPLIFTVCYLVFSGIYYAAGGTDRRDRHFIYPLLNWETPIKTLIICLIGLIFVTAVHGFVWVLAACRKKLAAIRKRGKKMEYEVSPVIGMSNLPC